jgi:hypothetical protein
MVGKLPSSIPVRSRLRKVLLAYGLSFIGCAGFSIPAHAVTLINSAEAALPDPPPLELSVRGVDAMSGFVQMLPPKHAVARSHFHMLIRFEAVCNPSSVVMTLVKQPSVDLTARIRPYLSSQGIDVPDAEAPPGDYKIRLIYRDTTGLQRVGNVLFSVAR